MTLERWLFLQLRAILERDSAESCQLPTLPAGRLVNALVLKMRIWVVTMAFIISFHSESKPNPLRRPTRPSWSAPTSSFPSLIHRRYSPFFSLLQLHRPPYCYSNTPATLTPWTLGPLHLPFLMLGMFFWIYTCFAPSLPLGPYSKVIFQWVFPDRTKILASPQNSHPPFLLYFLFNTYCYLLHYKFYLSCLLSPPTLTETHYKIHEDRNFCLFCSLLYPST